MCLGAEMRESLVVERQGCSRDVYWAVVEGEA